MQEFSKRAWDPKVQVAYKVDSGQAPRKVEIERRKRQFAEQAKNLGKLLQENGIVRCMYIQACAWRVNLGPHTSTRSVACRPACMHMNSGAIASINVLYCMWQGECRILLCV